LLAEALLATGAAGLLAAGAGLPAADPPQADSANMTPAARVRWVFRGNIHYLP